MDYSIDPMQKEDWEAVGRIYLEGIRTGNATFQTEIPTWQAWDEGHCQTCRLVVKSDGKVAGWAALSKISNRAVYAGVAEVSIYMDQMYKGRGFGQKLLGAMVDRSEEKGYWTLQAGIFPENIASIRIHEKCGFQVVGIRKKLGKMTCGKWRDVAFLERRSTTVGTDSSD